MPGGRESAEETLRVDHEEPGDLPEDGLRRRESRDPERDHHKGPADAEDCRGQPIPAGKGGDEADTDRAEPTAETVRDRRPADHSDQPELRGRARGFQEHGNVTDRVPGAFVVSS